MPNFKTTYLFIALIPLAAAGCVSAKDQRAADQDKCASYGYQPGTNRFADCMRDQDWQRQDDQRRTMDDLERQERRDQRRTDRNWQEGQDMFYKRQDSSIDTTPQFDKDGNPNFDAQGNYQGCHGIGCEVDNPDDGTQ
ncbi:hypothetical protein [Rhizobium sp. LCM 4573]|uniref:hypothetical protein n=1 Tax=Rhizobium sp. LCM 4573 TaxID=1848291 RepID=UPI0008D9C64E|nr:hypothetical protein [Rhizobium sp. LCM 4573]OHV83718.1 hypothetical protein LCM4573_06325 [Rhizobium sp. LCM 4573]